MNKQTILLILLIAPIPAIILNGVLAVVLRGVLGNNNPLDGAINLLNAVVGFMAVVALIGFPVWLYMYIKLNKAAKQTIKKR